MVIGNKCDADTTRQVDNDEVEKYCKSKKIKHILASAKKGDNVSEAFQELSEHLTTIFPKNDKDKTAPGGTTNAQKKRKDFQLQTGKDAAKDTKSCCL